MNVRPKKTAGGEFGGWDIWAICWNEPGGNQVISGWEAGEPPG